jgi:hypothetical protein
LWAEANSEFGRFEIICHIPTENIVREEQQSSRPERTSDRTEERRRGGSLEIEAGESRIGIEIE